MSPPPLIAIVARRSPACHWLDHAMLNRLAPEAERDNWRVDIAGGAAVLDPLVASARTASSMDWLAIAGRADLRAPKGRRDAKALLSKIRRSAAEALADVQGGFALAAWDSARQTLIAARDPLGHRRLFYRATDQHVIVTDDLERLIGPGFERAADPYSVFWYLASGTPAPGRSMFADVACIPAASALILSPGRPLKLQRYWSPLIVDAPSAPDDATVFQLRHTFDAALRNAANRADRAGRSRGARDGVLLSGGVDSTYLLSRLDAYDRPATAFTIRFPDASDYDEVEYARLAASSFETSHRLVDVDAKAALGHFAASIAPRPEPCATWTTITQVAIQQAAVAENVDVLWSGLGSDEIFGGYDVYIETYLRLIRWARRQHPPAGTPPILAAALSRTAAARRAVFPGVATFISASERAKALAAPLSSWDQQGHLAAFYREALAAKPEADPISLMVAHETQHRIPDMLLSGFDGLARAQEMTGLYPFLAPELLSAASAFAPSARFSPIAGQLDADTRTAQVLYKWPMFRIANGRVPKRILLRPRRPFTAPFGRWFRADAAFGRFVREATLDSRLWDVGLLEKRWFVHAIERLQAGDAGAEEPVWAALTLAVWFDRFIATEAERRRAPERSRRIRRAPDRD